MCVVSMVGDSFRDRYEPRIPEWFPDTKPTTAPWPPAQISRQEFDALKREVQLLKDLLERAIKYDALNNEPHCETEEKLALLRAIAEHVGVKLPV